MAHKIDEHAGLRLRQIRKAKGFSQQHLADRVGLTFQQVQKYERGSNRISASKLWEFAEILEVDIREFFPSKDEVERVQKPPTAEERLAAVVIGAIRQFMPEILVEASARSPRTRRVA